MVRRRRKDLQISPVRKVVRVILRGGILLAVAAGAWVWWQGTLPTQKSSKARPSPPASRPDGALIVPSADKPGQPSEPMVLVPVTARTVTPPVPIPVTPTPVTRSNFVTPVIAPAPASLNEAPRAPYDEKVLAAQVAMARRVVSSGSFDGVIGSQTRAALRVYQQMERLPVTGALDAATSARLELEFPLYVNYVVTDEDVASLQPLGRSWLAKSHQSSLAYETILELVAERSHSNPKLVRWLNPNVNWDYVGAGTSLQLVNAGYPYPEERASEIHIFLSERKMQVFSANSNLLAHFPCSIAARVDKRPSGEELYITKLAPNPNYTMDPAVFPESDEAQRIGRKLIIQPGPNNPVGAFWFSLDKPGYGIHGTPKPEEVGRTESHGCFRLANWNAEHLLKLVTVGTPVFVEP